jgi:RHH-type transcriptional regulator, rel operon repressor / antitoxin RelB
MLAIRLPPEIEKQLERLAKRTGRTKTFYAREAILNYIEDLEDGFTADARWNSFVKSGDKAIPMQEIMREYGLED